MNHAGTRLVYVMGPSGAGKDSLLQWLKDRLVPGAGVHWARRSITRPLREGDEQHEALGRDAFEQLQRQGALAMDWEAHGLLYGVRLQELLPLERDRWVVVSGSRAYWPQARARYPELRALHVTAAAETLQQRLERRQRESPEAVRARLQRSHEHALGADAQAVVIHNDDSLDAAGAQLLQALQREYGWPAHWFSTKGAGTGA